jgi:hypothetical protein
MKKALTSIAALAFAGFIFSGVVSVFQVALENIDDTMNTAIVRSNIVTFD